MHIFLQRPGLFIGKGGNDIDAFSKYLSEHLDKPVKITLDEVTGVWEDQVPMFNLF